MSEGQIKIVKNGSGDVIIVAWWMKVVGAVLAMLIGAGGVNAIVQLAAIPVLTERLDGHDKHLERIQQQLSDNVGRMERAIESANISRTAVVDELTEALNELRIEMAEHRGERRREREGQ